MVTTEKLTPCVINLKIKSYALRNFLTSHICFEANIRHDSLPLTSDDLPILKKIIKNRFNERDDFEVEAIATNLRGSTLVIRDITRLIEILS